MIKDLYHYILISRSGIFDPNYYLKQYPDVRKADVNPLWHFIRIGWKEGRNPTSFFNTRYYLDMNPDVEVKGINPLLHYIKFGLKEGRQPRPNSDVKLLDDTSVDFKIAYPIELPFSNISIVRDKVEQLDTTVSVIIPTKNAGEDFEFLLKMLRNQIGLKGVEIIIVDSGSQDETIEIAENYDLKIIPISPESFTHSYARNVGGDNASGEYLFFTVQDALPPTKTFLYELVNIMKSNHLSAVSCAELPREDADLFYRLISWNHYEFLDVNKRDKILSWPDISDYQSLRKNGQLSDLACLIPSDIFKQYKFRINYAEDLDLGIRLIKDGHNTSFLGSTRIIHSHNRSAFYFLKRGYVDNLYLSDIFQDYSVPSVSYEDLIPSIILLHNFFIDEIIPKLSDINLPISPEDLIHHIEGSLGSFNQYKTKKICSENENDSENGEFFDFVQEIANLVKQKEFQGKNYDLLIQPFRGFLQTTYDYLKNVYELIDDELVEEIKLCLFKELSLIFGAYLAYCYIYNAEDRKDEIKIMHTTLVAEI